MSDFFDKVVAFLDTHTEYVGILIFLLGCFLLYGSIKNIKMIFENKSAKIFRKNGRMFMSAKYHRFLVGASGVILIFVGIIWFVLYLLK